MKRLLMIVTLLATTTAIFAQGEEHDEDKKKKKSCFIIGLMVGIDFSSITGDSESFTGQLPGGQIGLAVCLLDIAPLMSVRGGIEFSQQGGKYDESYYGDNGYSGGSGKIRTSYLNFPFTVRYQSKGGFYGEAGLQPGVLLSAKDKFEGETNDYKDRMQKFDMGIVIGGGYQINKNIGVGLRVVPGITNINKSESTYEAPKDRNLVFGLRGYYNF